MELIKSTLCLINSLNNMYIVYQECMQKGCTHDWIGRIKKQKFYRDYRLTLI